MKGLWPFFLASNKQFLMWNCSCCCIFLFVGYISLYGSYTGWCCCGIYQIRMWRWVSSSKIWEFLQPFLSSKTYQIYIYIYIYFHLSISHTSRILELLMWLYRAHLWIPILSSMGTLFKQCSWKSIFKLLLRKLKFICFLDLLIWWKLEVKEGPLNCILSFKKFLWEITFGFILPFSI